MKCETTKLPSTITLEAPMRRSCVGGLILVILTLFAILFMGENQSLAHPRPILRGAANGTNDVLQRFFVIGDWGTGGDTDGGHRQSTVAAALAKEASSFQPDFVVSTGDQMYDYGVMSVDSEQFQSHFENIYSSYTQLQVPWFMAIGNHDCLGLVDAQVQYTHKSDMWDMPSAYYTKEISVGDRREDRILIHVLDACALVCGDGEDFRCEDEMKKNVNATAKQKQLQWLDEALKEEASWKIVVAHWPIFSFLGNGPSSILEKLLIPKFLTAKVDVYFSGHDHSMQHIKLKVTNDEKDTHTPDLFVSGAGGYRLHSALKDEADHGPNERAESLFAKATFGFAKVGVSTQHMDVTFIDVHGNELYHTRRPARATL